MMRNDDPRQGGALPPGVRVVLLAGEEFQRNERLAEIVEASLDPATKDFNHDVFYGFDMQKTADAGRFGDIVLSLPLMAERRIVVLRFWDDAGKNSPDLKKKIAGILADTPDTTLVLIEGDKISLGLKPVPRFIREESFKPVYENALPSWIEGRFRKRGKRAAPEVVAILRNNVGNQLRELDGEIEKIVMVAGDAPNIVMKVAEKIVGEYRRYTVYGLQTAIGTGNFAEAAAILRSLMESEKGKETTFTMNIAAHIMKLSAYNSMRKSGVSHDEALKETGGNPFFWKLNDMGRQVRNFGDEEVRRALTVLAETDSDFKRSGIDNALLMELALPRIMP
jgi:DNA polymerase III subunit delta